jgi:hypothetical protein
VIGPLNGRQSIESAGLANQRVDNVPVIDAMLAASPQARKVFTLRSPYQTSIASIDNRASTCSPMSRLLTE